MVSYARTVHMHLLTTPFRAGDAAALFLHKPEVRPIPGDGNTAICVRVSLINFPVPFAGI